MALFTMIYLIISWYIVGVFGLVWVGRKLSGRTTRKDLIIGLTVGGIAGPLTWIVGIPHLIKIDWLSSWLDKDVF